MKRRAIGGFPVHVLDVRDSAEVQPFEVSPEPGALTRTLATLRTAR